MAKRPILITFGFNFGIIGIIIIVSLRRLTTILNANSIILMMILLTFLFLIGITLLLSFNIKAWIIYYRYKWTYYTLQYEWTSIINKNVIKKSIKNNWFIKNNNKYGKLSYGSFFCVHTKM